MPEEAGSDPEWMVARDGNLLNGTKQNFSAMAKVAVEMHRDVVLTTLATKENARKFCEVTVKGMEEGKRTQYIAFKEMMKLVGEERKLVVEFVHSMGVQSEEDLRRYVEAAKSVEGAGPHEGADRCVNYLDAYCGVYPDQRAIIIKRLGGYIPVEMG